MQHQFLRWLLVCFSISSYGQSNSVSTGASLESGNRKISYSIGQVFYQTQIASTRIIRQGLQQPVPRPVTVYEKVLSTYLGTSGTSLQAGSRKLSYTIGQPFYAFKSAATGKVRDGIQQPLLSPVLLNLHLYIEGFYQGAGVLAEVIGGGYSDTLRVELRDPLSPASIVYTGTTLLNIYGNAHISFPPSLRGEAYYVVIRHRNSIETWSKYPLVMSNLTTLNLKTY